MRLSLRDPTGKHDVTLITMDRDVGEWLAQWFTPADGVIVTKLETDVIATKRKPGRPPIGKFPMTNAEHQRRWRDRRRGL